MLASRAYKLLSDLQLPEKTGILSIEQQLELSSKPFRGKTVLIVRISIS